MSTRQNSSEATSVCLMMSVARWFSALFVALALAQPAARAQTSYPLNIGGYLGAGAASTPDTYNAGYTFYSAAWPMVGDYPRNNQIQTGLYGTWMFPSMSIADGPYTDIEGGLGWWFGREFQTATPKFIMGGVAWGNNSWWFANSPGSGSAGGNGKYGAAQLSPSLLMPPDGLNLRQGTSGQLFGYGYLALPLTQPKTTTAGVAVPTGNHCWTLFLNTGNFKGPAAFFTPYFWSQVTVTNPQWAGQMFDTRWANANKSISMETPTTILAAGCDTADSTYVRSMPVYFPVDSNGYSLLMHRLSVYDQGALWDDVGQWLTGSGPAPGGVIDPGSTYVQTATGYSPVWGLENGSVSLGTLNWEGMVTPYAPNQQEWGYQWATHELTVIPSTNGSLVRLPEYYQGPTNANSTSKWFPIDAANVPASVASVLAGANLSNPASHNSVVLADSNAGWTNPGPVAGPYRALLGDGSVVTYYWYRFADQPALLNADMTLDERNQLQTVVEKMHREWKNDRDYTAPPTAGTLADLDPGQLVTPPLGLEYGYVPIAWRQDWGGSATSPGALDFTAVPAIPAAGTPFNVTVRALNANGAAQNVTSNTLVQLSIASGYGTLSGTTEGTIPSGSSSVTITGVIYSAADTMTLTASATCLSPGTSPFITFTNSSGKVNLYNRPATGIVTNQAMLNATLDCRGTNADVHVYWGIYNGGTNPAGWTHSAYAGAWNNVVSTNISYAATGLLPDTTYYFIFRGTNASGLAWASKVLSFTTPPLAPVITGQPVSSTHVAGSTARFTVVATRATLYQWFKGAVPLANGGPVAGADTATLSLSGVAAGDAGSYSVVVSNGSGQATSATAGLTVVAATTLTWDANGTGAGVTDGGGQWAGNTWWNGTANVNWADNHNARIGSGGSGGIINLNELVVNDLTLSNFSGTYTLGNGTLTVAGNLTFNASGSAKLSPVIRGAGSLTKNGSGTLTVDGVNPNTYSGGTVVNNGTLVWGTMVSGISPECGFACGAGPVTLNSGATIRFERAKPINALTLNGGTLISSNGWGVAWSGQVTVNSNTTVQPNYKMDILGDISGPGGFTKTGSATLTLSGSNTYSGTTVVQTGTMSWLRAVSMSPGPLSISNGAVASLNYTGTRVIGNLTLGGAARAPGTYGSTASPATNKNDTYFSGTGTVTILPATSTTLALTGGGAPANPGAPLTFTATVTGTAPTGNVTFHDGTTLLGTSPLNGSFQAGFTTSSLAIGSHGITAQYAGDATNAASTSATLAIQITSVTAAPPANVFAAPGNNNINLTWTTSAGAASYHVKRSLVNGGPYTVIANPGVANHVDLTAVNGTPYYYVVSALNAAGESANSSQVSAIPAPLPSTTTVTSSLGTAATYGDTVTFTATVAVSGGPATGTVTFKDGATVLGFGTLDGSGQATYTPGRLAVGSHPITATFSGDATFGPGVSPGFIYAVSAKPVTIAGMTASNKEYDGTTAAALTGGMLTGVLGGDSVSVAAGGGTFASPNAGTWAVTVGGFALAGGSAGNYVLSAQPTVANATITARPVMLTGTRAYDATATVAAGNLTIMNKVGGDILSLTGSADLAGKDVGAQIVTASTAAARVQSAKGNTGANAAATIRVTMGAAPVAGNTMIAVIATRGTSANIVSSINQTWVSNGTWVRASQSNNTSMTTEIWYAPNMPSGAGTAVTINQASFLSAAVVMEYSGVLVASPLDQIAPVNSVGTGTAAVTGTITATTQANELWIGGIGFAHRTRTLGTILNSFTAVDNATSTNGTNSNNARVYALERFVSATGAASSGGTISSSTQWAGTIATFKTVTPSTLALAGAAAANYTLTGSTGTVTITPKALTVTGLTASHKVYDGTSAAVLAGTAAFLTPEAAGAGTSGDGKPYTVDVVTPDGTAAGTFADPAVGTAKAVTVTGVTVTGGGSGNYTVTQPVGLTANLTARELTITADNQSKTYGQTLTFGSDSTQFTSSGLQNGETIDAVTLACNGGDAAAAVAGSPYPITPGAATGGTFTAGNYTIDYVPGTLTVNPAEQTITFGPLADQTFGDAPFSLTAKADSGLTVSYASSDPTVASVLGNTVTILKAGSTTLTASQAGDANHHPALPVAQALTIKPMILAPFAAWAADPAQGLTAGVNDGPLDDPDHDGIANLLEFALGGAPMVSSQAILPVLTKSTVGVWTFEYDRNDLSLPPDTTQIVEYGSDLTGWTAVTIPTSTATPVTITPGSPSDHVKVAIPNPGTKVFVRLKVTQ